MEQYEKDCELSSLPPTVNASKKGQRNEMRTIARAASVLRALADGTGKLSLGQLAKATGLPRSSIQRIVGALEAEGFVNTQAGQSGVRLGRELVRLGSAVSANLRTLVRPYLQELHQRTKDTVDLTMLMDGTPIVVDQISSTAALRVVSFIGRPLPLHATASGKCHLANLPWPEALDLLQASLHAFTDHTVTSTSHLEKTVSQIGAGEFGYDREEYEAGICAIALPIHTFGASNYAIALSMPVNRFADRLPLLREALRNVQHGIEKSLGTT
jgi:IclR family transcriptional regulator, acetate operon repressor